MKIDLYIRLKQTGSILAKHRISQGKGLIISDPSHRERNTSKRDRLILEMEEVFPDKENIQWLIQTIKRKISAPFNRSIKGSSKHDQKLSKS